MGLHFDTAGNILLSGWFVYSIDFGGGPRTAVAPSAFVAWYDANGSYLMDKSYGGQSSDASNDGYLYNRVGGGIDPANNAVLAATQNGPVDFGETPVGSWRGTSLTVLKVDPTP